MFQDVPIIHTKNYHNRELKLETGLLAQQATSSVLAQFGETVVLAAVVVGKATTNDYFPLQVVYEERLYASGKIKGSRFIKREGRPSDNAILTGRMIDRSLRSLFDPRIRSEVQVIITVLSVDEVNSPDTLAVLAASSALMLATKDFQGPVSSMRVARKSKSTEEVLTSNFIDKLKLAKEFTDIEELLIDICRFFDITIEKDKNQFKTVFDALVKTNPEWAANLKKIYQENARDKQSVKSKYTSEFSSIVLPSYEELEQSQLDLVVSGNGQNIVMIEAGANIVPENEMGQCLDLACKELEVLADFQKEFIEKVAAILKLEPVDLEKSIPDVKYINYWHNYKDDLEEVLYRAGKKDEKAVYLKEFKLGHFKILSDLQALVTQENIKTLEEVKTVAGPKFNTLANAITDLSELKVFEAGLEAALEEVIHELVKKNILDSGRRLDGRNLDETRKIICQTSVLPRTHGSSLFQRGETQVLNILTLGTKKDAQLLDDMEDFEEQTKRYIHHYNFPAYSVGETGRYSGPGRREIGHGALAEKALLPVLPTEDDFSYTMRLVSECLGSNGSTSMASTCASCLSLMDGGVPIKDMVAGVAMGLILDSESGKFKVLTDIQGAEDKYGDMDFKVTGTPKGITAIQLDNKVAGLTPEILKQALVAAEKARMHILSIMKQAISEPRNDTSKFAPRVMTLDIPMDKIGDVIGPSGKIIKGIIQKYEVEVDIEDLTGRAFIYGKDLNKVESAFEFIKKLIREYKVGDVVSSKVFRIESYGAFVKIDDSEKEGMIHISQLSDKRVNKVEDVLKIGQVIEARIVEINEKGQLSLSIK